MYVSIVAGLEPAVKMTPESQLLLNYNVLCCFRGSQEHQRQTFIVIRAVKELNDI